MDQPELKYTPPKLPFYRQLRIILIVGFTTVAIVPVLLLGGTIFNQATANNITQSIAQLESVATLKTDEINLFIDNAHQSEDRLVSDSTLHQQFLQVLSNDPAAPV